MLTAAAPAPGCKPELVEEEPLAGVRQRRVRNRIIPTPFILQRAKQAEIGLALIAAVPPNVRDRPQFEVAMLFENRAQHIDARIVFVGGGVEREMRWQLEVDAHVIGLRRRLEHAFPDRVSRFEQERAEARKARMQPIVLFGQPNH